MENISIPIIGSEFLSTEMQRFIEVALADNILKPGVIKAIFISTKEIKKDRKTFRAAFDTLTESVIISLREIFDTAIDYTCRTTKPQLLSVQAMCHMWFMEALCHEIYHAKSFSNSKYGWDHHAEEPEAEEFSIEEIYRLVKKYDYILPAVENDGWFGNEILDWYDIVKDTDEEPLKHFVSLHKDKAVFRHIKTGSCVYSLREFFRVTDKNPSDPVWSTVVAQEGQCTSPAPLPPSGEKDVATPATPTTTGEELTDDEYEDVVMDWSTFVDEPVETVDDYPPIVEVHFEEETSPPRKEVNNEVVNRDPQPCMIVKPSMSVAAQSEIAKAIFGRLFTHIFDKCGWNHETGKWDSGSVGAVFQPIPIDDIQGSKEIVLKMNAMINGTYKRATDVDKYIIGDLTKAGIPKYELFLNANGHLVKRVLVPASVSATGTTAAKEMLSGVRVAWLVDGHVKEGEDSIVLKMSSSGSGINFEPWRNK